MPKVSSQQATRAAQVETPAASSSGTPDVLIRPANGSPLGKSFFDSAVPLKQMPREGYKFLFFGVSGTGKTTIACDFPKPLLLVRPEEAEDGSKSVVDVTGIVTTPQLTDPDQLADIVEGQTRTRRYKTVVIDGATRFQNLVTKRQMGWQSVPARLTWGMVSDPDWNRIGIVFMGYLQELLALAKLGTNVVIVAGERIVGDRDDDKKSAAANSIRVPRLMAALTPSITGWLHEVCDYTIRTFTRRISERVTQKLDGVDVDVERPGKVQFGLHVGPHEFFATKFRCSKRTELPEEIFLPRAAKDGENYAMLDRLIRGVK